MKYTRLCLCLALCAVLGLSVSIYTLRQENARLAEVHSADMRDMEGLAVRAAMLEKEKAPLEKRAEEAEAQVEAFRIYTDQINTQYAQLRLQQEKTQIERDVFAARLRGKDAKDDILFLVTEEKFAYRRGYFAGSNRAPFGILNRHGGTPLVP